METHDLFFCRYCDEDLLDERIKTVAEDQNIEEDEAKDIIDTEGEIGLCRACQSEEDSDW
jgi:hypothetical protein